ncbi:MAG: TIM barrel protein [Planctomycetes bacterium]|nr:TIM barrel protein [Planctomycetota bacterium]
MSKHSRRSFLKASGGVLTVGAIGGLTMSCRKAPKLVEGKWPGFDYAMCNESMKDLPFAEQCKIVVGAGYTGIEIAPFTLVMDGVAEITATQRQEMVKAMTDNGLKCAGLHWLLAPPPTGLHFTTPDDAVRAKSVDYLNELIDFCGDLGGKAMIFGSPKQRNTVGISIDEAKKHFADGLAAVADHAQSRGVQVLIEPLDKTQTDVVNTTAEAMELVEKIDHPAIQTMFDFHNTVDETETFEEIITNYFEFIQHVHVMEMDGTYLGTGDAATKYVKAFQTLKDLGYNKWVSLEVFDFTPGGKKIAEESIKVLREIESKLT